MQQNKNAINTQSGNIFLMILIGVILFGALGYTFSKSANKGTGNLTKQQAKIAAQEILNHSLYVQKAIDKLRLNGCSESEISFYSDDMNFSTFFVNAYSHNNAPTDFHCHIFHENGGKLIYPPLIPNPQQYSLDTSSNGGLYTYYHYINRGQTVGVGQEDSTDLSLAILKINRELCTAFNKLTLNTSTILSGRQGEQNGFYDGTFYLDGTNDSYAKVGSGATASLYGKEKKCLENPDNPNEYNIFIVLLAR